MSSICSLKMSCLSNLSCYRYVRVCLHGLSPSNGVSGTEGYVLLENPVGENPLTLEKLEQEVSTGF